MEHTVEIGGASIQGAYSVFQEYTSAVQVSKVKSTINENEVVVQPIVKFFLKKDDSYEEIYLDFNRVESTDLYTYTSSDYPKNV